MKTSWTLDLIRYQLLTLESRRMHPSGISVSMDILMCPEIAHHVSINGLKQQAMFGIPLTIIGDKDNTVAWSFDL